MNRGIVGALTGGALVLAIALPSAAGASGSVSPDILGSTVFDPAKIQLLAKRTTYSGLKKPAKINVSHMPLTKNLTQYAEPVGDQGKVGSCAAWAIVYGMGGWWANKLNRMPRSDWFNPMAVYAPVSGNKNAGTAPNDILNYATYSTAFDILNVPPGQPTGLKGIGMTKAVDYAVNEWNYFHVPTPEEKLAGRPYRFSSYKQLFRVNPLKVTTAEKILIQANIVSQLGAGRPVALALRLLKGWTDVANGSGMYKPAKYQATSGSDYLGDHEVLALGYDGAGVLIQNSWGTGWRDGGYWKLSWNYVMSNTIEADVALGLH